MPGVVRGGGSGPRRVGGPLRSIAGALFAASVLVLAAKAAFAEQALVRFSPAQLRLLAKGGQHLTRSFEIHNQGASPLALALWAKDAWYDQEGRRTFHDPGAIPRGAGRWLSAPPPRLWVGPGKTASFEATIQVPPDAEPGSYFGAYLVRIELDRPARERRAGKARLATMGMVPQMAIMIHTVVTDLAGAHPPPVVKIESAEVSPPTASRPLEVRVRLSNPSPTEASAQGDVAVFTVAGKPVGRQSFDPVPLWPGQTRLVRSAFPIALQPGTYQALVAFHDADLEPLTRAIPFQVEPPPAPAPPPAPPPSEARPRPRRVR